jgi:hypothetical protein
MHRSLRLQLRNTWFYKRAKVLFPTRCNLHWPAAASQIYQSCPLQDAPKSADLSLRQELKTLVKDAAD